MCLRSEAASDIARGQRTLRACIAGQPISARRPGGGLQGLGNGLAGCEPQSGSRPRQAVWEIAMRGIGKMRALALGVAAISIAPMLDHFDR